MTRLIRDKTILNDAAYIHPTACIYGKVHIGSGASIWPYAVIRSECFEVRIGKKTNIQDFVMIHIGENSPTIIGDNCSITHRCVIHGATIENNCLIGIGSIIMDGCKIGEGSVIGASTLLKPGQVIPSNSVVLGNPGKVIATKNNLEMIQHNADAYYQNALAYAKQNYRRWEQLMLEEQHV